MNTATAPIAQAIFVDIHGCLLATDACTNGVAVPCTKGTLGKAVIAVWEFELELKSAPFQEFVAVIVASSKQSVDVDVRVLVVLLPLPIGVTCSEEVAVLDRGMVTVVVRIEVVVHVEDTPLGSWNPELSAHVPKSSLYRQQNPATGAQYAPASQYPASSEQHVCAFGQPNRYVGWILMPKLTCPSLGL
jgi:hypothetical protein